MTELVYTKGQVEGWEKFARFYLDPLENVMLLKGYSGTGKSTLVRMLIEKLPKLDDMRRLVDPAWNGMPVLMTATTNQAALSLAQATNNHIETKTIHTALSLKLVTEDYRTRQKKLIPYGDKVENSLIFVDEASYIDQTLLGWIFNRTVNCKIVFIGDPAQLTPVGSTFMPAFQMDRNQIELTELVRFDAGPMTTMVNNLRDTVLTGNWHKFQKHAGIIEHVDRASFEGLAYQAFTNPGQWGVSKILAFHNDRVMDFNNKLSRQIVGTEELRPGSRVVSNDAASNGQSRIYNNEEVLIEDIMPGKECGVDGYDVTLNNKQGMYFMPKVRADKNAAYRTALTNDDLHAMKLIDDTWVDLRPTFSCTVNKSQGSTYDTVFIDLDDIARGTRTGNQLARYLYVGNSRGRTRCVMTGDIA